MTNKFGFTVYGKAADELRQPEHEYKEIADWALQARKTNPAAFDFLPQRLGGAGMPFISQFAISQLEGSEERLPDHEGFDVNALYDVTRNIILGQGVAIPYPEKYWTAEVHLNGWDKPSSAFLFSVDRTQ